MSNYKPCSRFLQSRYSPSRQRPSFDTKLTGGNSIARESVDDGESISVDGSTLKRIFDRLNQLEQQQVQQHGNSLPNNMEGRIAAMESSVEHMKKTVYILHAYVWIGD